MANRIIRSNKQSTILSDSLASLLILEAINPSKEIYIISPWITNSKILDNSNNDYSDLFHLAQGSNINLIDILNTYAFLGSKIKIICNRNEPSTQEFIKLVKTRNYENIEFRYLDRDHEKGMVTENFYIHGSMNFTFNGIHINGEKVRITTDTHDINSATLDVRARWEEAELIW